MVVISKGSKIFDDEVIIDRACGGDNIVWAENQRENDDDGDDDDDDGADVAPAS